MNHILNLKTTMAGFCTAMGLALGWKGILVLAWVSLMALDYLSGTFAALKSGTWASRTAREGAWHKGGAILVVLVAAIADAVLGLICGVLPVLNVTWPGILLPLILSWYILTELGSILENAAKLGAEPPAWLARLLEQTRTAVDTAGESHLPNP